MSHFQFRLARVLRVREVQAEMARLTWQEAEARARSAWTASERMREARVDASTRLATDLQTGEIAAANMIAGHDALDGMDRAAGRLERTARTLSHQASELRMPFEERRKEVRGLERMRDKRKQEHLEETLRKDSAVMDEVAASRTVSPLQSNASPNSRQAAQAKS
ncbi:MAG: flagellar export protein FliJ [Planctomycetota bacterium]|jgi:flagellar export protein FliJ